MQTKNLRKFKAIYLIFVSLMVAHAVLGQENGENGTEELPGVDITIQDVADIITGIACWLIRVSLAVMIIFLLISGVRFFLAQGNQDKLTSAKKGLLWAIIGIAVILGTNVIIATVANLISEGAYSFNPLDCP